jgi:hypothetical protein
MKKECIHARHKHLFIQQLCRGCFIFTVQLRLAIPGLLHVKKIQEWTKRNSLHQENHPEIKYFLDIGQNKKFYMGA